VNTLTSFTLPCCGSTITLYVAVHKIRNSVDIVCCIQKSSEEGATGIPANWWLIP